MGLGSSGLNGADATASHSKEPPRFFGTALAKECEKCGLEHDPKSARTFQLKSCSIFLE